MQGYTRCLLAYSGSKSNLDFCTAFFLIPYCWQCLQKKYIELNWFDIPVKHCICIYCKYITFWHCYNTKSGLQILLFILCKTCGVGTFDCIISPTYSAHLENHDVNQKIVLIWRDVLYLTISENPGYTKNKKKNIRPQQHMQNCLFAFFLPAAMDMPMELMALNVTPQGALLRWTSPLSNVDNYVLTLTRSQGKYK